MEKLMELMNKKEELCEELQQYYRDGDKFNTVRHPLIFSVPHSNQMNALLNAQLIEKKKAVDIALEEKDYNSYIFLHEKPYRFNAFVDIMDNLTDAEYWEILGKVWENSENIWQNKKGWIKLLTNRENSLLMMDEDELKVYNSLPNIVTVYRGYIPNKNKNGLSYSLDKDKAVWFSERFGTNGAVFTKQVIKSDIIAYKDGRGEKEVIVL
jgi:hypothetical protein